MTNMKEKKDHTKKMSINHEHHERVEKNNQRNE
jgi:hypothetical protein